jgi:hypothetical protein
LLRLDLGKLVRPGRALNVVLAWNPHPFLDIGLDVI